MTPDRYSRRYLSNNEIRQSLYSAKALHVVRRQPKALRRILTISNHCVAAMAQQAANLARFVAVIYAQAVASKRSTATYLAFVPLTNCATVVLKAKKFAVSLVLHAVSTLTRVNAATGRAQKIGLTAIRKRNVKVGDC